MLAAMQMEHVATLQLNRWCRRQSFREANHAHVVGVLLQVAVGQTPVQTGQASLLVADAAADVTARMNLAARVFRVLLAIVIRADIPYRQQTGVPSDAAESAYA